MTTAAFNLAERMHIPAGVSDLEIFRAWAHSDEFPDTGKVSFIGGEIEIDMSPEELNTHNRVKRDVTFDLEALVRKLDVGELFVDGAFLSNAAAGLATEPDLLFCAWESIRRGGVRFEPATEGSERLVEICGAPDIIAEIVSRSSAAKDRVLLKKAYFAAGVREYWLLDARGPNVEFQILARGRKAFRSVPADSGQFVLSSVFGRRFRLVRKRNRIGAACYTLLSR